MVTNFPEFLIVGNARSLSHDPTSSSGEKGSFRLPIVFVPHASFGNDCTLMKHRSSF